MMVAKAAAQDWAATHQVCSYHQHFAWLNPQGISSEILTVVYPACPCSTGHPLAFYYH